MEIASKNQKSNQVLSLVVLTQRNAYLSKWLYSFIQKKLIASSKHFGQGDCNSLQCISDKAIRTGHCAFSISVTGVMVISISQYSCHCHVKDANTDLKPIAFTKQVFVKGSIYVQVPTATTAHSDFQEKTTNASNVINKNILTLK